MWSALALVLVAATPGLDAPRDSGFDAMGVPLLSFNSDVGVGYGAVGGAYIYGPGKWPYAHALSGQAFFTTRGVQNHFLRYDGPGLFPMTRVEVKAELRRELYAPYYGPGNLSSPEFENDFHDTRYAYDRMAPGGWVRLRFDPLGAGSPLHPYLGYGYHYDVIKPYPGSLLEQERPRGIDGGPTGQFIAGVLFDTRDDESDSTRGGAEELSVRAADAPTGSRYRYAGVTASEKRFASVGNGRLIFGERLTFDAMAGDVPFYEWYQTGGLYPLEGVGGMSSVRGVPRNRYGGTVKVISNTEVRFYPFSFPLLGRAVKVGVLGFADFGHAWQPGVDDGGALAWHQGYGAGLRLARRAAVLRFDWGWTPELSRNAFYVTFGHTF